MRAIFWALCLFGLASTALAAEVIRPVTSWSDYRDYLVSKGMTTDEADAEIVDSLRSLNSMDRSAGNDRIGAKAPPFQFDAWLNSEPMDIESLRGKVVLVRWWTDTCPFCASAAPALRNLDRDYRDKGLVVLGVFHPKAGRDDPLDVARVQRAVDARGFTFPVAIDWDWRNKTLKDWWLTGPKRPATSVTFLVDKQGVIQFVHPGMEYHAVEDTDPGQDPAAHQVCPADLGNLQAAVERLLVE